LFCSKRCSTIFNQFGGSIVGPLEPPVGSENQEAWEAYLSSVGLSMFRGRNTKKLIYGCAYDEDGGAKTAALARRGMKTHWNNSQG
jgi:hypothetical protein